MFLLRPEYRNTSIVVSYEPEISGGNLWPTLSKGEYYSALVTSEVGAILDIG